MSKNKQLKYLEEKLKNITDFKDLGSVLVPLKPLVQEYNDEKVGGSIGKKIQSVAEKYNTKYLELKPQKTHHKEIPTDFGTGLSGIVAYPHHENIYPETL